MGSDGRTLYFIRGTQARDGIKTMDIYTTVLQDNGTWSNPEPLGPTVNTPYQEESVQIHPDGNTCLLYTSDAADERSSVDLGGRRIIKQKNNPEVACVSTNQQK